MRDKLEAAWKILHPEPPLSDTSGTWLRDYLPAKDRFRRLLDAEAYLDAVMMLVPEGWDWSLDSFDGECGKPHAWVCNHGPFFDGTADTPADALLSAILASKETDNG